MRRSVREMAMDQIDELLKINEYNIYDNPNISDEGIKKIAGVYLNFYRIVTGRPFKKLWNCLKPLIQKQSNQVWINI